MASVRVAVRVRPMNRREKDLTAKCIISMEGTKTSITNLKIPDSITGDSMRDRTKTFTYDFSYDSMDCKGSSFVSQEKVFRDLGSDVLKAAFEGYNACVFAYGQTGSGKSFTMMGAPGDAGLIPRICEGLFTRITEATRWDEASFRTEVSYLEIYNERVRDLLRRKSTQTYNLRVREHPKDGPYVEDLSKHLVQNYADVEELMEAGNINRTTASTDMNDVSSRSHAIFTINFTQAKFDTEMPCETLSKIHLVDLAGSERADATGATGVRLKEGGNINKSLVTLGNVISSLADIAQDTVNTNLKKKSVFVPYRDSVLTWLLKDSLGGNSKTIMIATISPADINYGETLSTLRYANRAKNIINKPTINEDGNVRLIRELRAEIARLKALLVQGNKIALLDSPTALSMEEKLHQNEARVLELTKEWTNKWNETQNILKEETLALRKEGIGVVLDSELPHLIGIDDDLLSTGIILYHLKEGRTFVGREDSSSEPDIILHGLDLDSEHCVFENNNGTVTLVPLGGAQCSVNGVQVVEPLQLNQGAVILLGRTNMFRFNHPKEAARLREKRKSGLLSTFSLSMTDLSKSCENLSTVMLYNPGLLTEKSPIFLRLEFERQQREELEKLELKRRLIKEMEAKQQSEKAELQRLQQEVESQRKESEEVQQRILRQEESLRRRSQDIESRLRDFLAEKERFEEERRTEIQGAQLEVRHQHMRQHNSEGEEVQTEERWRQEAAEQTEIYRELERLKREREEQRVRLEVERRRLEDQEREQLSLVGRLEEQLREKHEAATSLLTREDARRLEEERRALADIRETLLRAKEAAERPDVDNSGEEAQTAQSRYLNFKEAQVKELDQQEKVMQQQREQLEKEVVADRNTLLLLTRSLKERQQQLKEVQEKGAQDASTVGQEEQLLKQTERQLHFKERQLVGLADGLLPALAEEKQRATELLERSTGGANGNPPPGLDNILYEVEKELEEKEERLSAHWLSAQQLQQLQDTYEFTANVARQEEKVRRKEKEILESKEKQQREAMEQAVARLERRHSALRRSVSLETDAEEHRHHSTTCRTQRTEAERDQQRVQHEIEQLRRRISEVEDCRVQLASSEEKTSHSSSPVVQTLNTLLPLADDRINAYIEEEVQRRLRRINLLNGDSGSSSSNINLSESCESLRDDEKSNFNPRRLKYETASWFSEPPSPQSSENSPLSFWGNVSDPMYFNDDMKEFTEESLPEKQQEFHSGEEGKANLSAVEAICECVTSVSSGTTRPAENKWDPIHRAEPGSSIPTHQTDETPLPSCSKDEPQNEAGLTEAAEIRDVSRVQSPETVVFGPRYTRETPADHSSPEKNPEAEQRFIKCSHFLGYFTGKLSEVYRDAGKRLQGTRDLIGHVGVDEMKLVLSQYVTMVNKEFPRLYQRLQPSQELGSTESPRTEIQELNKVQLVDLCGSSTTGVPEGKGSSVVLRVAAWPTGSVSSIRNTSPQVYHQWLVQLPSTLSQLQESSSQQEALEYLAPLKPGQKVLSIFWLKAADSKQPIPKPACLLLTEVEVVVIAAGQDPKNTLTVVQRLNLREIREIQIGLAGQHVRLIRRSDDSVLAIFTHSKDLTRHLCRALLMALRPEGFSEENHAHPLLSDDLMVLSLDWTSKVHDLVLDNVCITSRFKRVLADLLYIIHGNMEGPVKPSLAHVRPLLYTSVKVQNRCRVTQDTIVQFFLTDSHLALLREDAVFHEVPRGSGVVPAWPQFQGVELRSRSDIRCLLVRQKDDCLLVEIVFRLKKPRVSGRRSDSWKLTFGCTAEAHQLIDHLCEQG